MYFVKIFLTKYGKQKRHFDCFERDILNNIGLNPLKNGNFAVYFKIHCI